LLSSGLVVHGLKRSSNHPRIGVRDKLKQVSRNVESDEVSGFPINTPRE
jgi:hypothetical protein